MAAVNTTVVSGVKETFIAADAVALARVRPGVETIATDVIVEIASDATVLTVALQSMAKAAIVAQIPPRPTMTSGTAALFLCSNLPTV